jgi:hypothetical protein
MYVLHFSHEDNKEKVATGMIEAIAAALMTNNDTSIYPCSE